MEREYFSWNKDNSNDRRRIDVNLERLEDIRIKNKQGYDLRREGDE